MEINVGDYVRTKDKGIKKVCKISLEHYYFGESFPYFVNGCILIKKANEYIIKHSKDIIDLIEVGDYVNGGKVINITNEYIAIITESGYENYREIYLSEDIKSILTHEQFESNAYKIEKGDVE